MKRNSHSIILRFLLFYFLCGIVSSTAQSTLEISDDEYEVINAVFSEDLKNPIYIYNKVYYDKGWANYFEPGNFESITSNVGFR